jgi:hypothetical protein
LEKVAIISVILIATILSSAITTILITIIISTQIAAAAQPVTTMEESPASPTMNTTAMTDAIDANATGATDAEQQQQTTTTIPPTPLLEE